jgi:hypothetical protein
MQRADLITQDWMGRAFSISLGALRQEYVLWESHGQTMSQVPGFMISTKDIAASW